LYLKYEHLQWLGKIILPFVILGNVDCLAKDIALTIEKENTNPPVIVVTKPALKDMEKVIKIIPNNNGVLTTSNIVPKVNNNHKNKNKITEDEVEGKEEEEWQINLVKNITNNDLRLQERTLLIKQQEEEQQIQVGKEEKRKKFFLKTLKRLEYISLMMNNTGFQGATNFFYSINIIEPSVVLGKGISTWSFIGTNYGFPMIFLRYPLELIAYISKSNNGMVFSSLAPLCCMSGSYYNSNLPSNLQANQRNYFQSTGIKLQITDKNYYYGGSIQLFMSRTGMNFMNYLFSLSNDSIFSIKVLQRKKKNMHLNLKLFFSVSSKAFFINSRTETFTTMKDNQTYTLDKVASDVAATRILYKDQKIYTIYTDPKYINNTKITEEENFYTEEGKKKLKYCMINNRQSSCTNYYYPTFFLGMGLQKQFAIGSIPNIRFYYSLFLIFAEDLKFIKDEPMNTLFNIPVFAFTIFYKKLSFQITYLRGNLQFDMLYQKSFDYNLELLNSQLLFSMERDKVYFGDQEYAIVAS
jgi:hypothetical protein